MNNKGSTSWLSSALLLMCAVAVAYLIYALASENRDLKAQIAQMQQGAPADGLQAGDSLADVPLTSLSGDVSTLSGLVDGGGVVVFLTTTCPYCKQTLPVWERLAERYAAAGVPFAAVSFHDRAATEAYAAAESVGFPLWVLDTPEDAAAVRVPSVPFTAIVGPEGAVVRAWLGPITPDAEELLVAALEDELAASSRFLSGSSDRDPRCCEEASPGTGGDDRARLD